MSDALNQALTLMQQRRYTDAAQQIRAHLSAQPDDPEAQGLLMQIQEKMMLEMQIQQKLKKAREQLFDGDPAGARATAQEILGIDPGHPEAEEIIAGAAAAAGGDAAPPMLDAGAFAVAGSEPPMLAMDSFATADAPAAGFAVAAEPPPLMGADDLAEAPTSFGIPAFNASAPPPAAAPAAGNLSSAESAKVNDFLGKGRNFIAAGNHQDAIDILTRVFIIDENNAEAQQLIDQARAAMEQAGAALDNEMNDAVGMFNAGDFNGAKVALGEILKKSPDHAEALNYLRQITQKESEAALASPPAAAGPATDSFEIEAGADAIPDAAPEPAPAPAPRPAPAAAPSRPVGGPRPPAPPPPVARKGGLPGWAIGVAVLMVVAGLGGGGFFLLKSGNNETPPPTEPVVSTPRPAPPPPVSAPAPDSVPASVPAVAVDPHQAELEKLVAAGDVKALLAQARKEYDTLAYGNVRMLLKEVEGKEPNNPAMLQLRQQTDASENAERDYRLIYDHAVTLLAQNEYDESVRTAWKLRLPETQMKLAARLQLTEKVYAVWGVAVYNASLQRMRMGNVDEADSLMGDFDEAYKQGMPKDELADALRSQIRDYKGKPLDAKFYNYVNGLHFRPPPQ